MKRILKTELLAPAKDKETACAAIDCGADAIYIGASSFGARRNAPNSLEDIKYVVDHAHKFWAKVFVTVNTILTDKELDEAIELIKKLDEIGVDAIIVQDMGLVERIIHEHVTCNPNTSQIHPTSKSKISPLSQGEGILLHASTQCDNRIVEKVKFFKDLGFSRVVLARELSLEQIKEIHEQNPNLELEAFVHGALCVSYSGQCYLSQYIGGRSANRGECAQPCRKKYSVETSTGKILLKDAHPLCLKDFNASKHLKEMINSGIYSFKIEGRLKDSGYVKNVTAYYRQELDKYSEKSSSGRSIYQFVPNPEKSFNRGFTDYFLNERGACFNFLSPKSKGEYLGMVIEVRKNCFKIESNKKINSQDGITYGKGGFLVNKVENGFIYPNKAVILKVGEKIYRNSDVEFEKRLALPVKRQIEVEIIANKNLVLTDEDGVSIKLSLPQGEEAKNPEKMKETFVKQFSKTGDSDFYIKKINADNIPFLPISEINKLRREAFELLMQERLKQYKREKQNPLKHVPYYKQELDYKANVHNSFAKEFYAKCGAEVLEMSLENSLPNHEVELMRTKHCIKYALGICKSPEKLFLCDEYGKKYPLKFDCKNCEMVVLKP